MLFSDSSTIFTLNRSHCDQGDVLGDSVIESAVLDRVLNHSIIVNIKGEGYRLQARKRAGVPYPPPAKAVGKVKQTWSTSDRQKWSVFNGC